MSPTKFSAPNNTGLLYVFTGNGKGKTSAALGTAVRGLSRGWRVVWISWYKEPSWHIGEFAFSQLLTDEARARFTMIAHGAGFYIPEESAEMITGGVKTARVGRQARVVDDNSAPEHRAAAQGALARAATELASAPDLLILDELCNALADQLLTFAEVEPLIQQRGRTHLIMTGRNAPEALIRQADLVSAVQNVKHPYDAGKLAVAGLDF